MIDPRNLSESGVLLVDKPEDWTSHDAVNCVRRRFRLKKVGHCGTLDPIATGLLVLVLGRATKLSDRFLNHDKVYSGTLVLGVETDTQDRVGNVIATRDPSAVTETMVRREAARFIGPQQQTPPMVSAVKIDGKKLYEMARKGQEVERQARSITVHDLVIDSVSGPYVDFHIHCSKGTYVRTLGADLGRALGCGAHVSRLRRLRSGPFSVDEAIAMERIKQWERDDLFQAMIPLVRAAEYLSS